MFKTSVICCMLDILRLLMKLPGTECQPTCFKNSSYIFSKGKIYRFHNNEVCSILGGYLVSIETEEEWQFINHEIQKRGTWNTSTFNAWLIGLEKKDGVWIWKSGEQLNISKWRDSEPNVNDERAEISMNGSLFNGIPRNDKGDAYICEMPGECPNITFKNSWYIISVDGEPWYWGRHTCSSLGGDLVSFETQEEWSLINDEIQRRNTTNNENKWRIGLRKRARNWTWVSGRPLTISKWGQGEPSGEHDAAFMYKRFRNGERGVFGSQCNNESWKKPHAYICEIPKDSSISSVTSSPLLSPRIATSPSPSAPPSSSPSPRPSPSSSPFPSPSPSPPPSPSQSPSPSPSPVEQLAKEYISKFGGINITRRTSLQVAVTVFEDFTLKIKNVTKDKAGIEEVKTLKTSIFEVAEAVEKFALNYGNRHLRGMRLSERIVSPKMVLVIQKAYHLNASGFDFEEQQWRARIDIASSNFEENGSMVVAFLYKDLHDLLLTDQAIRSETDNQRYINSRIMAVTMDPKPEKLRENVILNFKNLKVLTAEKRCMFWSSRSKSFSEEGCHVVTSKSNSEETVCSCNHLTHFAVLLDYDGSTKLTEEDETILKVATYVGLSLSIIGILLTLILYSCLTDVRKPLSQIRLSVSISLGAGQIIFLAGINATENKAACVTIAALMQYFFMAAFCWMLIEGIYLYFFVVKVYNINTKMYMYHVISWGLPVIMVAISLGIAAGKEGLQSYTSDKYCWLSSTNNLIWIFVALVAFIEVLNILILLRVIREMTNLLQPTGADHHFQQIRLGIKTCVVMIPQLGVTWLFGLLSPVHKAFAYIFTILNSTQGFLIFALHCMRNTQIRERFKRKMNIVFPSSIKDNSSRKSPQVNPNEVGSVWAI
ncbi:adhesion G protein-coupled receptor L1-like isoform X1 [Pocillopora verrucosa]|uniref:adhesion G protein-coupled receptor L1-like isoform X1 n=1 Tax=Pocillopora verrucosa TaxID=203993 RepID=UPI0033414A35